MMILHDEREQILIVKFMGGVLHECATCFNEIDWIHDERGGWLPRMKILYDGREYIQIVKLMVGVVHESATCEFAYMFKENLLLLGIFKLIGAIRLGRFGGPSCRSK
jgi:hypothetical protein